MSSSRASPKLSSASASSSLYARTSSASRPTATPPSPTSQVKAGLKKLSVSASDDAYGRAGTVSSPVSRSRLSPTGPRGLSGTTSSPGGSKRSMASSAVTTTPVRSTSSTLGKAPVQSPTGAGMKLRPNSGVSGVSGLSSLGPAALSTSSPYSSSIGNSVNAPASPIASASPNARRYKSSAAAGAGVSPPASPIHSISQSGAAAASRRPPQADANGNGYGSTVAAGSAHRGGAYAGLHAPVNTHAQPPPSHQADHATGSGPTIFSPVYTRTASQEALLRSEEEKARKNAAAARAQAEAEEEERYRAQLAAQYEAQQQAAAQRTVSYTPPAVEEDEFDPFLFIKNLPPLTAAMRNRRSPIPKKSLKAPPITLALDLDETLVHCSVQPIDRAELTFNVSFNGMEYEVYVRTRPHMRTFLETVSQWFEVLIFTASQQVYADKLLDILDPHKQYIKYRVFRDSCVNVDGNYLKDLHILGRDMHAVAIVDNSVQAFGFQLDNGIPIESWFDDDNDRELLNLLPFLKQLKDCKDVRPLIRDTFRLSEFVASL